MKHLSQARPYANAAYLFAKEHGVVRQWLELLNQLAEIFRDEALLALLKHPKFDARVVIETLMNKLGSKDVHGKNFLMLLAENHRLALLPEIAEIFAEDVKRDTAIREVTLTSAMKLAKAEIKALEKALETKFKQPISMTVVEDPSLIGGVIVQSGDYVMDASLRGQLQHLKQNLTL